MSDKRSYLQAVDSGVVVFDGASGTNLQLVGLTDEDFGGPEFDGCIDILNVTRPDVVAELHRSFLDVGVDVVETNTFGAFAVPLGEYGIAHRAYEIAAAGASIARKTVDSYIDEDGRTRWVAGSIGPGTKFATLGQISYRDLRDAYQTETAGLIDGGVDLLIIETQYDLLGAKAAIEGSRRAMTAAGVELPIQVQVTIELTGRMLAGTEIGAALTSLRAVGPDIVGLNCATGPTEMWEPLRHLTRHSKAPISAIPNAGLPKVVDGEVAYDLDPETLASHLHDFVTELGVGVIGGCCGTTPAHLAAVVERVRGKVPAEREATVLPSAASIYSQVPFDQDTSFLMIGERANTNGSKAFRDALLADDIEGCVTIGQSQLQEGAHLVDLCVDYVGRDGVEDMSRIAAAFATDVAAPVVLDSTEPEVMEAGLERLGGRSILNSANLEDGEAEGSRLDKVFKLAARHGAAVICLLIDEKGQARTLEWKLEIAHRIHDLAVERYGLDPSDLIFDALTFPLTTGGEDLRQDGIATLEAIKRIKSELPGVRTVLGVSNVSFGLNPAARQALNSVFLHEAVEAGLDAAIVHAGKIEPLTKIDPDQRQACLDLIYDRRSEGYDPLERILELFADAKTRDDSVDYYEGLDTGERLARRIVDGDQKHIIEDLDIALDEGTRPLDIINDFLLDGMKTVGDQFASGEMQLPFVLKSAETMKKAVSHLEPLMEKSDTTRRGAVILATVSGDVHDIGKNLVDIILRNNGYEVYNLGIKVGINEMIQAYEENRADAIGMSGLLVKSTLIMKDNLEELERRGHGSVPVLLGGAALTRSYVEADLRSRYAGPLYYGKNAFAGLDAMGRIMAGDPAPEPATPRHRHTLDEPAEIVPDRAPSVEADNEVFHPPFSGSRVVKGINLDEIVPYLNLTALFRNQWQFRPNPGENDREFKERLQPVLRDQLARARADELLVPQVVYGYFPANGDGDDLVIWEDESRTKERTRFSFPRQQEEPFYCIADFYRPIDSGEVDYAAFHIVTMGDRISERTKALFDGDEYQEYLLVHGLGVELAEALAEFWHHRIRTEWGFVDEDGPTLTGLFRQKYRGGRYSWGYPACPDLEDNQTVAELLQADRIGIVVNEETGYQYQPEQTTSAIIAHHPKAKYFIARKPRETRFADA
ncbi:MAG TPA: methionine synthase [Acidimicrobiia bacterium]|nr:methionine synthase [Acidimicrobiia bacterium]